MTAFYERNNTLTTNQRQKLTKLHVRPNRIINTKRKTIQIIIWQGKSKHSDWFSLGQDFATRTVSMEMVIGCVFNVFESPANSKQAWPRVPYNKLLTNLQ